MGSRGGRRLRPSKRQGGGREGRSPGSRCGPDALDAPKLLHVRSGSCGGGAAPQLVRQGTEETRDGPTGGVPPQKGPLLKDLSRHHAPSHRQGAGRVARGPVLSQTDLPTGGRIRSSPTAVATVGGEEVHGDPVLEQEMQAGSGEPSLAEDDHRFQVRQGDGLPSPGAFPAIDEAFSLPAQEHVVPGQVEDPHG
jgi:hypothetical protein